MQTQNKEQQNSVDNDVLILFTIEVGTIIGTNTCSSFMSNTNFDTRGHFAVGLWMRRNVLNIPLFDSQFQP